MLIIKQSKIDYYFKDGTDSEPDPDDPLEDTSYTLPRMRPNTSADAEVNEDDADQDGANQDGVDQDDYPDFDPTDDDILILLDMDENDDADDEDED